MKPFFNLLLALALLVPAVTRAQSTQPAEHSERRNAGGGAGPQELRRIHAMLDELKLTDAQREQINGILDKAAEELRELRQELAQSDLRPRERMARVRDAMAQYREQLAGVLDKEQLAAFHQKLSERFPATRPGAGRGRGMVMQRINEAMEQLELSDQQKGEVDAILAESRQKMQQLRQEVEESGQRVQGQFRDLMRQTRDKLDEVLTDEQKTKLRELLPGMNRRDGNQNDNAPSPPPEPTTRESPAEESSAGAQVGDAAPGFALRKLDGQPVQLSAFKGRIVVLEFGSLSTPSFRDRAAAMEQLKRDFGARVTFLVIYTREAHAKDEWDVQRNQDDHIEIAQPTDDAGRIEVAKRAREAMKITIPIALDDLSDSVATAYGGMPNAAVIVDRDGTIAYRQTWCDPEGLHRKLDELTRTTGPS
jgi:Spy/CpxP family protein refolding chaperone